LFFFRVKPHNKLPFFPESNKFVILLLYIGFWLTAESMFIISASVNIKVKGLSLTSCFMQNTSFLYLYTIAWCYCFGILGERDIEF